MIIQIPRAVFIDAQGTGLNEHKPNQPEFKRNLALGRVISWAKSDVQITPRPVQPG